MRAYPDPSLSKNNDSFGHAYPWQIYTRILGLELTAKLEASYPADALRAELEEVLANYAPKQQFGPYHKGGWKGIALHAIDGNPLEDQDEPDATFEKTPALKFAPTMEAIIDSFPCYKRRIRILKLSPGHKIYWHRDFWHSIDSTQLRLHVPIITNDKVGFQISHQDCRWQPGELWYGDFTFPHRLQNAGENARVHLVIDLMKNDELVRMLPTSLSSQQAKRMRARKRCGQLLEAYTDIFATENRLALARQARTD
jgi:hypothetical protein